MNNWPTRFNIYLLALLGVLLGPICGCKTTEEKQKSKVASTLRLHLEVNRDDRDHSFGVPVYRKQPVNINIYREPFLDEGYIVKADVVDVDDDGGFGIRVQFDKHGTMVLEGVTAGYKGQRIAVFSLFNQPRWLAAPRIAKHISDGVFVFTPDATREEAERIVQGINNVVKKLGRSYVF